MKKTAILTLVSIFIVQIAASQSKSKAYINYINKYKNIAIEQQSKYKIPASITLAQGLLESGAGNSYLTKKSNNHFGIKCHDWKGAKVYHDDDKKGECFRKYKDPADSYRDHSLFLTTRSRYAKLFDLKITDYKGWAKGLKECGYATDKAYPNKLISIIETYELHKYDVKSKKSKKKRKGDGDIKPHATFLSSGLLYIESRDEDTLEDISKEFKIKVKNLAEFNEIEEDFPLSDGMIIYLEEKNKYAADKYKTHTVRDGESMYDISQRYGMKVASLYKLNRKRSHYMPNPGDVLKLRK